jgi:hypothetical protein
MEMKYFDGQTVRLGDRVRLGEDTGGVVVALIDSEEYDEEYSDWRGDFLKHGILAKFPLYGLIHYEDELDEDLILIARKGTREVK